MPEPVQRSGQLALTRSRSRETWLVTSDGGPVIARSLTEPPALSARTMSILTGLRSPRLVPLLGIAELDGTTWLMSESVDGLSLKRLLTLATLTPAQVGHVGAQLLRGVAELHEQRLAHGRLHAANVLVSRSGEPMLTDWALSSVTPPRPFEELRRADLQAAGALLVGLAREARRPVVRGEPGQQALLARMERLGAGAASADPACAASELDDALLCALPEDVGTASVRAELAALVATATRTAEVNGSPVRAQRSHAPDQPPTAPRPGFVPPTLPRSPVPAGAGLPPRRRTRTRWILAAAAVLVLVAAGLIVARTPVRSLTDRLLHSHPVVATTSPASSTQTRAGAKRKPAAQVATPSPVAVLAPANAGFITGVVLRPLATCRPRSGCPLTVTIRLAPIAEVERMDWAFTVVNRCTGARTTVPGGSMTAQPGWTDVYDTRTVQLPVARFLAVVAVTTAPARAASPPLLITAGSRTC